MEAQKESKKPSLTVSGPEVREQYAGAKQYYVYTIQGSDNKGPIDIKRRYSDFNTFRNLLVKRWPGVYIPSLPSRIKVSNSEEQFVKLRINYLEKFLNYLVAKQFIWYKEEVQFFVKESVLSLTKVYNEYSKVEVQELIDRYEKTFGEKINSNMSDNTSAAKIASFDQELKQIFPKVNDIRNRAQQASKAQEKFHTKYSKFLIPVMTKYEQKCLSLHAQLPEGKTIGILAKPQAVETKEELKENLHQTSLIILFEELKRQKRQIQSFQQALGERQSYLKQADKLNSKIKSHESKIEEEMQGKKTFMEKIRKMSRQDIIKGSEESITKYNEELLKLQKLCQYIDAVMIEEIKVFQEERQQSYYQMVKTILNIQLQNTKKQKAFWKLFEGYQHYEHLFEIEEPTDNKKIYYSPIKQQNKIEKTEKKADQNQSVASNKPQKKEKKDKDKQNYELEENENTLSFQKKKNMEEEIRASQNQEIPRQQKIHKQDKQKSVSVPKQSQTVKNEQNELSHKSEQQQEAIANTLVKSDSQDSAEIREQQNSKDIQTDDKQKQSNKQQLNNVQKQSEEKKAKRQFDEQHKENIQKQEQMPQ